MIPVVDRLRARIDIQADRITDLEQFANTCLHGIYERDLRIQELRGLVAEQRARKDEAVKRELRVKRQLSDERERTRAYALLARMRPPKSL